MKWDFDSWVWLCCALAVFVAALAMWVFFPPDFARHKGAACPATGVAAPIPPQSQIPVQLSMPHSALDASGSSDARAPVDAVASATDVVAARENPVSGDAVLVLETVGSAMPQLTEQAVVPPPPPAPLFLKVRREFASLEEAGDYASRVLSGYGVEACQVAVRTRGAEKRFILLVGPFQTRREAARVQSRLTAAKVRTLFIDRRFLHRFQSIEPVSPLPKVRPRVSVRKLVSIPSNRAVRPPHFLGRSIPSARFRRQWETSNPDLFRDFLLLKARDWIIIQSYELH